MCTASKCPSLIAASFHEFSSRGVAVCNTLAVSEFHAAFAARNVPVLSWVHELPTFIESLGGKEAIERIKAASRKIMVPADAVRSAPWCRGSASIATAFEPSTTGRTPGRATCRGRTCGAACCEELALPDDARIVLGLWYRRSPQRGRSVRQRGPPRPDRSPGNEFFRENLLHLGRPLLTTDDFERWLVHDAGIGELEHHIRFIGPRAETAPYFWPPTSSCSRPAKTRARSSTSRRWKRAGGGRIPGCRRRSRGAARWRRLRPVHRRRRHGTGRARAPGRRRLRDDMGLRGQT